MSDRRQRGSATAASRRSTAGPGRCARLVSLVEERQKSCSLTNPEESVLPAPRPDFGESCPRGGFDMREGVPAKRGRPGRERHRRTDLAPVRDAAQSSSCWSAIGCCAQLGTGAFGVVWLARDERLAREVAVKAIPLDHASGRAEQEARAAARLSHPAIVTLLRGRHRGRHDLPRHRARARRHAGAAAARRRAVGPRRRRDRDRALPGARARPCAGRRPSRREAVERARAGRPARRAVRSRS